MKQKETKKGLIEQEITEETERGQMEQKVAKEAKDRIALDRFGHPCLLLFFSLLGCFC